LEHPIRTNAKSCVIEAIRRSYYVIITRRSTSTGGFVYTGATMCKTLFMNMLTQTLYFQFGIFYALTLITTPAHATSHLSTLLTTRTVTNTSKAGLAWPNGNSVNIEQYTSTGKVSWCVDAEFPECRSNIFRIQVLHLVNFPRESQYRIYPYVLGREVHRPMDIDGFQNPSKFRTNHNGCFGNE
jgi:hypothetical protein